MGEDYKDEIEENYRKVSPEEMGMDKDQWDAFVALHGMPGDEYFLAAKTEPDPKKKSISDDGVPGSVRFPEGWREEAFETAESLLERQQGAFKH